MKLLHTGDLHLDSAFCEENSLQADARRAEQRDVLRRIVQCATKECCDLILIAGDLFDGKYVTHETKEAVTSLLGDFGKPIFIAPGNHDPYVSGSFWQTASLPDNVYVFNSSELQCFEPDGLNVQVYGYAFTASAMRQGPLAEASAERRDGVWRLLCAHGELDAPLSAYAPILTGDILRLGIDYAALGHIHNPSRPLSQEHGEIRYCGFGEGRSFDECGDGGVWLVTLTEGEPIRCERRVISRTRYLCEELDLSACADEEAIRKAVTSVIERYDRATHLRLLLNGTVDPEALSAVLLEKERFADGLCSLQFKNFTLPMLDGAALQRDVTLKGAFYRALRSRLLSDDPSQRRQAMRALQIGLCAIEGRRIPTEEDGQ